MLKVSDTCQVKNIIYPKIQRVCIQYTAACRIYHHLRLIKTTAIAYSDQRLSETRIRYHRKLRTGSCKSDHQNT